MKKIYTLLFLIPVLWQHAAAQKLFLKKGTIVESLSVNDSVPETFSLYLPKKFTVDKEWPLLLVMDLEGKSKQTLSMFVTAAEKEGYILAATKVVDSISMTDNMVNTNNVFQKITSLLPIHKDRVYTAGVSSGARFASLVPIFIKNIKGVLSINASMANTDLLNGNRSFHFIGIVGKRSFNYTEMLTMEKVLDKFRFPNQVLIHEDYKEWPEASYLAKSLQLFTLAAMGRKHIPKDTSYIASALKEDLAKVNKLKNTGKLLLAEQYMAEMMSIYSVHKNMDSLRQVQKGLRKDRVYRGMKRTESAAFLKESLLKEDYRYFIEEDVITYNFNNLGWWNHQMTEINKFISGSNTSEKEMGSRLHGFVNALAEDNIDIIESEPLIDEDALAFLLMLKTILEPQNFDYYLKIISLSSKNEDYGTALFYLEEALKKGFKDKDKLYNLEDTALLRITPKFNKLVSEYLKEARYEIIEE
ncbi:MAG: alpha/beta hydrolase [Flavobacteriaceae bacterium]